MISQNIDLSSLDTLYMRFEDLMVMAMKSTAVLWDVVSVIVMLHVTENIAIYFKHN
jgi:hypothetical protein